MLSSILILAAAAQAAPELSAPVGAFGASVALEAEALGKATAREDLSQVALADQSAAVSNSSVSGESTTGAVQIDGSAFGNLSGFAIVNANTGNNVAVNAAINVNISYGAQPQP